MVETLCPILFLKCWFLFCGSDIMVCPIPAAFGQPSDVSLSRICFGWFHFNSSFWFFQFENILMIIHSWCQGRLLLRERCSRFFKRTEYKNSIDKADIHSAREDNPGSSGKTRTRLPTEWARLEEVERACRALRKLGAGVVGRRGVGRGAGA